MNNKIINGIIIPIIIMLLVIGVLMIKKNSSVTTQEPIVTDNIEQNITITDNDVTIKDNNEPEMEEINIEDIKIDIPDDLKKVELEDLLNESDQELLKILESLNK